MRDAEVPVIDEFKQHGARIWKQNVCPNVELQMSALRQMRHCQLMLICFQEMYSEQQHIEGIT